jgi:NADH-quinone oxidoreductase subunit N
MKQNFLYFLPELVLIGTIVLLFFIDFIVGLKNKRFYPAVAFLGIAGMMVANAFLTGRPAVHFFSGMVTFDVMGHFFKYIFGAAALLAVILSLRSQEVERVDQPSYYTLIIALTLGMMLLATANHLLMIYLALEMVSVLSYILSGYVRGIRRSSEAALKYVIYGGVASGIMAYGISILYGLTGTMSLGAIAEFLKTHAVSRPLLFTSVLLIMAGFGYKIASFPFHMWCPDVYEGAPTPFTAFLSVGPKAAGFAAVIRFFLIALAQPGEAGFVAVKPIGWPALITTLSIATMTVGNLAALWQTNLKRLLAYSSIAHAGYMLMGFAALNSESLAAILFYLVVYLIMNIGAFLVVILVANQLGIEDLDGYKGLGRRGGLGTLLGLAMAVFLFSLTGIPPMAGFVGKFYLFGAVIRAGLYGLAIAGVLNSVVSLYYYVRIIKVMFFDAPADQRTLVMPIVSQSCVLSGLAVLTLYFGLFWNGLATVAAKSTGLLF